MVKRIVCTPILLRAVAFAVCGLTSAFASTSVKAQDRANAIATASTITVPQITVVPVGGDASAGWRMAALVSQRIQLDNSREQLRVVTADDTLEGLDGTGVPRRDLIARYDVAAFGKALHAKEIVTITLLSNAPRYHVQATLVLARELVRTQPLGEFTGESLEEIATQISKELLQARKQFEGEKACIESARAGRFEQAITAAHYGNGQFPRATLSRLCLVHALRASGAPRESVLAEVRQILAIDSTNEPALEVARTTFAEVRQWDSVRVIIDRINKFQPYFLTRRERESVSDGLTLKAYQSPDSIDLAKIDITTLKMRWLLLYTTKDYAEMIRTGESLIVRDTGYADSSYFVRTALVHNTLNEMDKAVAAAHRGAVKYPNNTTLARLEIALIKRAERCSRSFDQLDDAELRELVFEQETVHREGCEKNVNRLDDVIALIRRLKQLGDTNPALALSAMAIGMHFRAEGVAAGDTAIVAQSIAAFALADSIGIGYEKALARFQLGTSHFITGEMKVRLAGGLPRSLAQRGRSCSLIRDAQAHFTISNVLLPGPAPDAPPRVSVSAAALARIDDSYCAKSGRKPR